MMLLRGDAFVAAGVEHLRSQIHLWNVNLVFGGDGFKLLSIISSFEANPTILGIQSGTNGESRDFAFVAWRETQRAQ